jgi:hypothetical protein
VWTAFYVPTKTSAERKAEMKREQDMIAPYENKWDFDHVLESNGG